MIDVNFLIKNMSIELIDRQNYIGPYYEVRVYFKETMIITMHHVVDFNVEKAIKDIADSIVKGYNFPKAAFALDLNITRKLIRESIRNNNLDSLTSVGL